MPLTLSSRGSRKRRTGEHGTTRALTVTCHQPVAKRAPHCWRCTRPCVLSDLSDVAVSLSTPSQSSRGHAGPTVGVRRADGVLL